MDTLLTLLTLLLAPVSSVITWFVARRKRQLESIKLNTEAIQQMQETIDELVAKNAELYSMVTALREENAELRDLLLKHKI